MLKRAVPEQQRKGIKNGKRKTISKRKAKRSCFLS